MNIRFSKQMADSWVNDVTASYRLDTCPGSSGSNVISLIVQNTGQPVKHEVPHSKGKPQGRGLSGGGTTVSVLIKHPNHTI